MTAEQEFRGQLEQHRGIIFKVIRLYVNHAEDERDLFQEIVYQAWKSYPRFDRRARFSTWLYRVALNTVLTFRRQESRFQHSDLSAATHTPTEAPNEAREVLYQAIRSLPELDRMLIMLHLDGYEHEEIADVTGLTRNHIGVKLFRIKEVLTEKLNPKP